LTKIIPQIAIGTHDNGLTTFTTVIQIINVSGVPINVTGSFFKPDGTPGTATLTTNLSAPAPTSLTDRLPSVSLPINQVLVLTGNGMTGPPGTSFGGGGGATPTPGAIEWGRIETTGAAAISIFFELRDARNNVLYSRVGVGASPADMKTFVIPRIRDVAAGLDVAFALVNTSAEQAIVNVTLVDANGNTIASKPVTLAGGAHLAAFTYQFFSLSNEPSGRNYNYILFDSATTSSIAAVALAFEGGTQTSFPVERLR
jgi:hypothetical protein